MQTRTPDNVLKHLKPEFFRNKHVIIVSHPIRKIKIVDVYNTEIIIIYIFKKKSDHVL